MRQVADAHKFCDKTLFNYFIKFFLRSPNKINIIKGYLRTGQLFKMYISLKDEEEEEKKTDFANNPAKSVWVLAHREMCYDPCIQEPPK